MKGPRHDEPGSDGRVVRLPDLVEEYKAQRATLKEAADELERRRTAVRSVAELEAAEIINSARRQIRNVIVNARRELLVLTAQIQAVGCEPDASHALPQFSSDTAARPEGTADLDPAPAAAPGGQDLVVSTRRRVQELLLEARSELEAFSAEARQLREDVARGQTPGDVVVAPPSAPAEAVKPVTQEATVQEVTNPVPRAFLHQHQKTQARVQPLMVIVAFAAAAVCASVLWVLLSAPGPAPASPNQHAEPASAAEAVRSAPPQNGLPTAAATTAAPPPPRAAVSTAPAAAKAVSLALHVRRPAWIRTTIDGTSDSGRVYDAGERRTVGAEREVLIRAGDAGAVFVSLAGETPRPLGRDGQVVTRRFAAPGTARVETLEPGATAAATPAAGARGAATSPPDARPSPEPPLPPPQAAASAVVGPPSAEAAPASMVAAPMLPLQEEAPAGSVPAPSLAPPTPATSGVEAEILAKEGRWFAAHYAGDEPGKAAVATESFTFEDSRDPSDRIPAGTLVSRRLEGVRIEGAGVGLVLSARMTERATVAGSARESVAMLTEVWVRRDDGWRLMGVRIAPPPGR